MAPGVRRIKLREVRPARLRYGPGMIVRPETHTDYAAIAAVVDAAFGGPTESRLIDLIRATDRFVPELSLVAEHEGEIVGHVMFSFVTIGGSEEFEVLSLAPLAVHPNHQRRGVGTQLTDDGIRRIAERGEPLIVVEGHPGYYPRFGFERASLYGIKAAAPTVPDEAFMVLRLASYDPTMTGKLIYPAPFHELGAIGP